MSSFLHVARDRAVRWAWLLPVALMAVALLGVSIARDQRGDRLLFMTESSYANLLVAEQLATEGAYAIAPGPPAPAVHDTLWRLALAGGRFLVGDALTAARWLGALCTLFIMAVLMAWTWRTVRSKGAAVFAGLLALVAPGLVNEALGATAQPMGTALLTLAFFAHVGLIEPRRGAPPAVAVLLVGMAANVRAEFLLFWPILLLHAAGLRHWILAGSLEERAVPWGALVRQLILLALCLLPAALWNVHVLGVPVPRLPAAPLPLDAWSAPFSALQQSSALTLSAVPEAYARLTALPFLAHPVERWLAWLGLLSLALAALRSGDGRYLLPILLLALAPFCYAVAYPYVGWSSVDLVLSALGPAAILAAACGLAQLPALVSWAARRRAPGGLSRPALFGASCCAAAIVLIHACAAHAQWLSRYRAQMTREWAIGEALIERIEDGQLVTQRMATDRPAWTRFHLEVPVVDLNGEFCPDVLRVLGSGNGLQADALATLAELQAPDLYVLWSRDLLALAPPTLGEEYVSEARARAEGLPRVFSVPVSAGS